MQDDNTENNAVSIFNDDTRDKKIIAFSSKKRRSSLGKVSMPSDFLRGWEKRKYMGLTRRVEGYNMYDEKLTKSEFNLLSEDQQKKRFRRYIEIYTVTDICKFMLISLATYYKERRRLGFDEVRKTLVKPNGVASKKTPTSDKNERGKKRERFKGIKISSNSARIIEEMSGTELVDKLNGVALLLSKGDKVYRVNLSIEEVTPLDK